MAPAPLVSCLVKPDSTLGDCPCTPTPTQHTAWPTFYPRVLHMRQRGVQRAGAPAAGSTAAFVCNQDYTMSDAERLIQSRDIANVTADAFARAVASITVDCYLSAYPPPPRPRSPSPTLQVPWCICLAAPCVHLPLCPCVYLPNNP